MLSTIRNNPRVFLFLLVPIVAVFAFTFGPGGSTGCGTGVSSGHAALVDGETVSRQEYALNYNRRLDYFRQRFQGTELTPQLIEMLKVKDQVIEQMISEKLLAQEGERLGMTASDEELKEFLVETYGVKNVSFETYGNWVRQSFGLSTIEFEERVRREIVGQKVGRVVTDNVSVSDDELIREYKRAHDRVKFSYVKFDEEPVDAAVGDDEASKALESNEDAVKEYFEENKIQFRQGKKIKAQQILLSLDTGADDAAIEAQKTKLLDFKKQVDAGADFGDLAKEHSNDERSKASGGDLGWVERGSMARPLEDAIFKLKAGEVSSEPVRTPQGLHLVRAVEVEPARSLEYEEAKNDAARRMLAEEAKDRAARDRAKSFLATLSKDGDWEALTRTDGEDENKTLVLRQDSDWLLHSQAAIPRIGVADDLKEALFEATKESPLLSEPYKVGRSYYVARLLDIETPDLEEFENEKKLLREAALNDKRQSVYEDWIKSLRNKAKVELNAEMFPPKDGDRKPATAG